MSLTATRSGRRSHTPDPGVESLREHLLREHHRSPHELGPLTLSDVHRLEHVEDELGLLALDHVHRG